MYTCMYGCINDRSAYIHTASCGDEGPGGAFSAVRKYVGG